MSEEQCNTLLRLHGKAVLKNFIEEGQFYDVCFEVQTDNLNKLQTFKGFKALFAVQSTKFHQILYGRKDDDDDSKNDTSMNSLDDDDTESIQIHHLHSNTFSFLQKLFYQSFDIRIDRQNVIGIMNAAKTYNIPHLWDCCFQYILGIDFEAYSSSFFFLLHETEKCNGMETECRQIIDCLKPIVTVDEFVKLFSPENKPQLHQLRSDTIIYLLFSARKFENIQQEYKWKMCLFWAQHNVNGNESNDDYVKHRAVSAKMQCYVQYFAFSRMDWSFFIEHVIDTHALADDKLIRFILCDYIIQHSHILSKDRGKMTLFPTKFTKFVQSQKSFVNEVQSNKTTMSKTDAIKRLVEFVRFNTLTIEDKQKQPSLYDKMDAFCENKWKTKSFLNAEQSKTTFTLKYPSNQAQIPMPPPPSQSVESLHPTLCDSLQDKIVSIMFSPTLGDVKFCLRSDQSVHYGLRALFARHSEVFHAMLFTNFVECEKQNTVYLDNVDQDTFEWVQSFFYGHTRAVLTCNNIVQIYRFSDAYLVTDLRKFALKFICWMYVDQSNKAKDLLSIIKQLHWYQGNAFWKLFIDQIGHESQEDVTWLTSECDIITQHPDFTTLSGDIIAPFLFQTGLFRCYSQEMLWHIIVEWCKSQKPPQNNDDVFLQSRLKPFLHLFAAIHELECVKLDAEEVLIMMMSIKLDQMNQMMQTQRWQLRNTQNILKHALFVSLPCNIVGHMVANLAHYHNVSEEITWNACVKWGMAQPSSNPLPKTLAIFAKRFTFYTMSIKYFETHVVSRNVLNEYQVMSVYERFCDYYGLNHTINTKNVTKLCMAGNKHSLSKLERNCLRYVAAIDVTKQSTNFLAIISLLFQYYVNSNNVFWEPFIDQIRKYDVTWSRSKCDIITQHSHFNALSKEIIAPFLFQSGLFRKYSQEMLWHCIVKWCKCQTPPQNNDDLFLQTRLKPFRHHFAAIHELKCVKLDSEEVLIMIVSITLDQMNKMMQKQKWPLRNTQNILKHALFVLVPFNIVDHMVSNLIRYHNVSEEIAWDACVKWSVAQLSSDPLNKKLQPFLKRFKFHTMSIKYFKANVVSRYVLTEYQVMSVYGRFCDYHGVNNTINTKNVTRLCMAANRHSLPKLETHCLRYVTAIDVAKKSTKFLTIIAALFEYNKISNFIQRMEQYLKANRWTKSQCWSVVNNKKYFHMLPGELVSVVLFGSTRFKGFTDEQLWTICVNWCKANSNNSTQRNEKLRNFVNYFRFQNMDISFFRNNVEQLNALTDSETMVINQQFVTRLLGVIQEHKQTIRKKENVIRKRNNTIIELKDTIQMRDHTIQTNETEIRRQRNRINELKNTIRRRDDTIEQRDRTIRRRDNKISSLEHDLKYRS